MAYNFSKGRQIVGDLSGSDDSGRDTGIDFEDDYIGLQTGGTTSMVLSGSRVGIGTTTPDIAKLDILFFPKTLVWGCYTYCVGGVWLLVGLVREPVRSRCGSRSGSRSGKLIKTIY